MMKKILAAMMTASLAIGVCGCASTGGSGSAASSPAGSDAQAAASSSKPAAKGGKVTIRFATQALGEGSVAPVLLEEFKAANPDVTLVLEEAPGNDLITKINTDIMANNCPDVFTYWRPEKKWDFDKYISLGAIADLGEMKDSAFYEGMFPDFAWATGTVDGVVRGIPLNNFYTCFFVNKTIFEENGLELPTDWDKLVAACEGLLAAGIIPWATDTGEGLDDASRLFNAVVEGTIGNERGLNLMQGLESWQQPDVIEALGYFMQVCKKGYAPEDSAVLNDATAISKYMNTNKAGMLVNNASQVWKNMTEESMDQMEVLNFPLTPTSKMSGPFNELDLSSLVYAGANGYNDPAKKELIVELIQTLTSREAAKQYAEVEKRIMPHLNLTLDNSKVHPLQQKAAEMAYSAEPFKWMLSKTSSDVVDDFRLTINGVWYGEFDSPEALAKKLDDNLLGKQG